jgi:hypothetical protein
MATKIVSITLTRTYYIETTIEVEVDEELNGEDLEEFLRNDDAIEIRLENGLSDSSLDSGDDTYEYSDPKAGVVGYL